MFRRLGNYALTGSETMTGHSKVVLKKVGTTRKLGHTESETTAVAFGNYMDGEFGNYRPGRESVSPASGCSKSHYEFHYKITQLIAEYSLVEVSLTAHV